MPERIRRRIDSSREELIGAGSQETRLLLPIDEGQLIARRAYERFEARGFEHGHDIEDWLAAESDVRNHASNTATRGFGSDDTGSGQAA